MGILQAAEVDVVALTASRASRPRAGCATPASSSSTRHCSPATAVTALRDLLGHAGLDLGVDVRPRRMGCRGRRPPHVGRGSTMYHERPNRLFRGWNSKAGPTPD